MDSADDGPFAGRALEQARAVAATIGDGVELRSSLIDNAPQNSWLGTEHSTAREYATPGMGLFATRPFRDKEFITLYDGKYLSGREEACDLDIQTHVGHKEHQYCDGHELALLLQQHGPEALIGRGGGCFANDPWSPTDQPTRRANAKLALGERGAALNFIYLRAFGKIEAGDEILFDYVRAVGLVGCVVQAVM